MRSVGRFLQLAALILLPVALMMSLSGQLDRERGVADLLLMLGFGAALFGVGWIMQEYGRK